MRDVFKLGDRVQVRHGATEYEGEVTFASSNGKALAIDVGELVPVGPPELNWWMDCMLVYQDEHDVWLWMGTAIQITPVAN